jgi:hypothetical protein
MGVQFETSPQSEAALRKIIEDMQQGRLNYDIMEPRVREAQKQQFEAIADVYRRHASGAEGNLSSEFMDQALIHFESEHCRSQSSVSLRQKRPRSGAPMAHRTSHCLTGLTALQWRMPALARRRCPDARQEGWHVYYGGVHVGTIAIRSGNPTDTSG